MSANDAEAARARAESSFRRKEESRAAAQLVLAEVAAKKDAELAKTARLRALRLEKEAAEKAAAAEAERAAKPKAGKRKA